MSKTVAAAEFQAHSLELLEEVAETHEEVVIVRNGKPMGRLAPVAERPMTLEEFRALGGRILGDITEPLEEWDMNQ